MLAATLFAQTTDLWTQFTDLPGPARYAVTLLAVVIACFALAELGGLRYIPNNKVGIVEKLWSRTGSIEQGRVIALGGEAGLQADVLRGGFHFGLWRWQYRLHKVPLVTVPQGKIAYVYARDGEPLTPSQTLGRVPSCNNFQDAREFLSPEDTTAPRGQRGRQRAILREGMYAVNLALFVVITEDAVYNLNFQGHSELEAHADWQRELANIHGFSPIVIGVQSGGHEPIIEGKKPRNRNSDIPEVLPVDVQIATAFDNIGIVTVHDGPSLQTGEIIAPEVGNSDKDPN